MVFALAGSGRMGITVSRKVGGAVVRNRVKRWIRECYRRRHDGAFPAQVDFVVVARPGPRRARGRPESAASWRRWRAGWAQVDAGR